MSRFPRNVGGYERTEPAGEWVVECESVHGKLFPKPMARITEPIVRCRDCSVEGCPRHGKEPGGFCKWGVPKEEDE